MQQSLASVLVVGSIGSFRSQSGGGRACKSQFPLVSICRELSLPFVCWTRLLRSQPVPRPDLQQPKDEVLCRAQLGQLKHSVSLLSSTSWNL